MHGSNSPAPSARAIFTEKRTYLRPLDEDSTIFETTSEALDRVIGHQRWLWENAQGRALDLVQEAELIELRDLMVAKKVSASGRVKWMGGTDIVKHRASAAFNCSFTEVGTPADVVDVFWLLLQGCGVGFLPVPGLLTGFPSTLKTVEFVGSTRTDKGGAENTTEEIENGVWTITFGDSAKGWSKGAGKLLAEKPRVHTLRIVLSELRPGGKRLKGYGWLSSGWEPLRDGLKIITDVLIRRADQLLDAIDIGDIVNALGTVLSSRRSAQIWLHNLAATKIEDLSAVDGEFIDAKTDRWERGLGHREQSNNSLVFWNKPEREVIRDLLGRILHTGEPGFVNGAAAKRRAPEFVGMNPCAEILLPSKGFCVAGDTKIVTRAGIRHIIDTVGEEIEVWNGEEWSGVTPYQTGNGVSLFRVSAGDGSFLDVTANHRWQIYVKGFSESWEEAQEKEVTTLELIDLVDDPKIVVRLPEFSIDLDVGESLPTGHAYSYGVFVGDGSHEDGHALVDLYGDKQSLPVVTMGDTYAQLVNSKGTPFKRVRLDVDHVLANSLKRDISAVFSWSHSDRLSFLAGLLDTDGTRTSSGGVRIYTTEDTARLLQLLLRTVGKKGSVNLMRKAGAETNFGVSTQDVWYVQISDGRGIPCHRVDVSGGHEPTKKGKYQLVREIKKIANGDSFCLTEPKRGMCVFGNMLTYQCNLMQVVFHRFNGDYAGLLRSQELAARANYRQTCVTMRDGVLQLQWDDNQKLLRLCGVSPTGYVAWEYAEDAPLVRGAAAAARNGANSMADELGLPRPRRVTQVQPAGTVSKVMGLLGDEVHEGAHLSPSRYIFNWVNFSIHDRIVDDLIDAGYRVKKNPADKTAVLVCFPIAYPGHRLYEEKVVEIDGRDEILEVSAETAIDQLERYRFLMDHYVDHNCSITVSFDENEIEEMVDWFDANWDTYVGVSFLKRNDPTRTAEELGFKYLPQECVSRRMFEEYASSLKDIDMSHDTTDKMLDDITACSTGACPVR